MARIHHNTLKKAKAHGLTILEDPEGGFGVVRTNDAEKILAHAADAKDALDLAILELTGNVVKLKAPKGKLKAGAALMLRKARKARADEDEELEDGDDSKSVVKAKYKTKYRPHKMTCGDTLAQRVRDQFMTQKDEDTGRPRLDFNAFVAFAKANECWVEGYRSLKDRHGNRNNGMIRMNVINRLRAKVKAGHKVVW